ncbi:succinyldiaminopimelate transaminase [Stackebrandtia soli]|uniref:succinyldiaminopimelate transaminase n=1 Tax=Stackebrandtia soli TaxID=1892856 RepID=UPI0039E79D43
MTPLPRFPWDRLRPYADTARAHPDGPVDLSMGTPVDSVPEVVRAALTGAADSPGYPLTIGTPRLRAAMSTWLTDVCGASSSIGALPTIGSKELVANLPSQLGLGAGDLIAIPSIAYPTYEIGALLAGADVVRTNDPTAIDDDRLRLIWLNHPNNPTGATLPASRLAAIVDWARERDVLVVADECYVELPWTARQTSILDTSVSGENAEGVLAVHSLSKRSNLAGYRAAFVAGDAAIIAGLMELRRHAGFLLPAPVQAAMTAALLDTAHADEQRERYRRRRDVLLTAVTKAGFRVDHSEAGLYLWITRDEDCWETVAWFAARGIVVAPGEFYGPDGARHVRVALTASDADIAAAADRVA